MYLFIVDFFRNVVFVIIIFNDLYGLYVVVVGVGFLLNDEMDDFSIKSGVFNMYGVIGGDVNKIESGKCMFSFMILIIIEKNGKLFMVVGIFGGIIIIIFVF